MSIDPDQRSDRAMSRPPTGREARGVSTTSRRRWPLLAIGASAGTATWSGWVGLGQLTGFGVVHPLPGIADHLTINTAVTLPVGVEAYAMYALSIATSPRPLPHRTRSYAWASSAAALLLGMAGQVAYHVITAHRPLPVVPGQLAPWWIIALVSCLPVLVLGAASLLWHLAALPDPDPADEGRIPSDPHAANRIEPIPIQPMREHAESDQIERVNHGPSDEAATAPPRSVDRPSREIHPIAGPPARRSGSTSLARPTDLQRVRQAIEAGELPVQPTASAIRVLLAISPAYARAARDAVLDEQDNGLPHRDQASTASTPRQPAERAEQHPELPIQKAIQPHDTNPEDHPRESDHMNTPKKDEEEHTYAVDLT